MPSIDRLQLIAAYRIIAFRDVEAALRLYAMGIQPGQELRIMRKSPFGDSYYVSIGNRRVAMRHRELSAIQLEIVKDTTV